MDRLSFLTVSLTVLPSSIGCSRISTIRDHRALRRFIGSSPESIDRRCSLSYLPFPTPFHSESIVCSTTGAPLLHPTQTSFSLAPFFHWLSSSSGISYTKFPISFQSSYLSSYRITVASCDLRSSNAAKNRSDPTVFALF